MGNIPRTYKTWGGNKSVRLPGFDYTAHVPYHIVIRTAAATAPFANTTIAQMACHELRNLFAQLSAYLAACCLMPDHVHFLMSPDRSGLSVGRYKGLTTNRSWSLGWSGRLWQTRFYDHIVRKNEDIAVVARYIYENPDRKGLPASYPYRWLDPGLG